MNKLNNDPRYMEQVVEIGYIDLNSLGKCTIMVLPQEENEDPRFHIINSDKEDLCSISLYDNKYYHKDIELDKDQRKALNEFIHDEWGQEWEHSCPDGSSRLDVARDMWIDNNDTPDEEEGKGWEYFAKTYPNIPVDYTEIKDPND